MSEDTSSQDERPKRDASEALSQAEELLLGHEDPLERNKRYFGFIIDTLGEPHISGIGHRLDRDVVLGDKFYAATKGNSLVHVPAGKLGLVDEFFVPLPPSFDRKEYEIAIETRRAVGSVSLPRKEKDVFVVATGSFVKQIEDAGGKRGVMATRDYMLSQEGKTIVTERWEEREVDKRAPWSDKSAMQAQTKDIEVPSDFWAKVYEAVSDRPSPK